MEDQPADSGDLTTGSVDKPARTRRWPRRRANKVATPEVQRGEDSSAADVDEPAEESATKVPTGKSRRTPKPVVEELEPESEASEPEPAQETESDPELADPEPPPLLMPYRPAGKRLLIAATAASVLFVAAGAFAGATLQPYLADRAAVETKLDIARTATEAITTLWTYTPDDMAALPDRSSRFLTGDFATEYRRYIDAIVAANAQAQVSNTTEVVGAAVESLSADEASALVYTNSVSTSPVSKNIPSLQYRSYRLTMERDNADWRITSMVPVTNLDLTPQL
ncbi:mammalian cell entry protein [Mycobacterium sp. 852013-51886_SCH5428379]|uniref:mammalian cell entry protein n=1 Tax=Mycobacterium sp. 852013-51886_SCH5428379 TaxID=1834111 RepID=UPI0008019926|nr:mammalian cell entry protein [Mycobacterium sp. 852013-51886_SCH5428379]OBB57635.1 mammalian cell entry protein [Mycobacterium sp. 852013-51886_SCH5428379]